MARPVSQIAAGPARAEGRALAIGPELGQGLETVHRWNTAGSSPRGGRPV